MARRATPCVLRSHPTACCPLGSISQVGELEKRQLWESFGEGMRIFGRFAVLLLLDGRGRFQDERGTDLTLQRGDLLLLLPDIGHRYGPAQNSGWLELYVVFEGPVFDQWYASGMLDATRPVVHLSPVDRWEARLRAVIDPGATTAAQAVGEVCRMQHLLADVLGENEPRRDLPWVGQVKQLIATTIPGSIDWDEIAASLCMSSSTFRRRFFKHFGCAPGQYRMQLLIDRACEMMQCSDYSDKQIAHELGFCDPFYFSRRFKDIVGQSPRGYRRSLP